MLKKHSNKLALSAAGLLANWYLVRPAFVLFFQKVCVDSLEGLNMFHTNFGTGIKGFIIEPLAVVGTSENVGQSGRTRYQWAALGTNGPH